jgi:hypothetical protein
MDEFECVSEDRAQVFRYLSNVEGQGGLEK